MRAFGGDVAMTRADHPSGTDRIAEVARALDGIRVIVNLQGDEPEIEPGYLTQVAELLSGGDPMATLCCPFAEPADAASPDRVKVVLGAEGRALYFSRAQVPHQRDPGDAAPQRYLHLGLYAYTRDALLSWPDLQPTPLEQAEKLEQLRALEHGWTIRVGVVDRAAPGIDTPADYAAFVERMRG